VPPTPNSFLSRLKNSSAFDHIGEKKYSVIFHRCSVHFQTSETQHIGSPPRVKETGSSLVEDIQVTLRERRETRQETYQREHFSRMPDKCIAANFNTVADSCELILCLPYLSLVILEPRQSNCEKKNIGTQGVQELFFCVKCRR